MRFVCCTRTESYLLYPCGYCIPPNRIEPSADTVCSAQGISPPSRQAPVCTCSSGCMVEKRREVHSLTERAMDDSATSAMMDMSQIDGSSPVLVDEEHLG